MAKNKRRDEALGSSHISSGGRPSAPAPQASFRQEQRGGEEEQQQQQQQPEGSLLRLLPDCIASVALFLTNQERACLRATSAALAATAQVLCGALRLVHRPECRLEGADPAFQALRSLLRLAGQRSEKFEFADERVLEHVRAAIDDIASSSSSSGSGLGFDSSGTCRVRELRLNASSSNFRPAVEGVPHLGQLVGHRWWGGTLKAVVIIPAPPGCVRGMAPELERGGAPNLQELCLGGCDPSELACLAAVLRHRMEGEQPSSRLKKLTLMLKPDPQHPEQEHDAARLPELLGCLHETQLEALILHGPCFSPACCQSAVAGLLQHRLALLQHLGLVCSAACDGDALYAALAAGSMPLLEALCLGRVRGSDETWEALGQALATPGASCLLKLKKLLLHGVLRSVKQLRWLMRGIGEGHGCPRLEVLDMGHVGAQPPPAPIEEVGGALACGFRAAHSLPSLRELHLRLMNLRDFDHLMAVWIARPRPSKLRKLVIDRCQAVDMVGLGPALAGGLAGLTELLVDGIVQGDEAGCSWDQGLAEALRGGAGAELRAVTLGERVSPSVMNAFLQAAAQGACPKLRCLAHRRFAPFSAWHPAQSLYDLASLGVLLTGQAACSATLQEVGLEGRVLEKGDVDQLTAHLLKSKGAVRLATLHVSVREGNLAAVKGLLAALRGRAGSLLEGLQLRLAGWDERGAAEVLALLVEALGSSSSLPRLSATASNVSYGPEELMANHRYYMWMRHDSSLQWDKHVQKALGQALQARRRGQREVVARGT